MGEVVIYLTLMTLMILTEYLAKVATNVRGPVFIARQHTDVTRDIDIANLSVRPSVRYVPVPDENSLTYRHSFFTNMVSQSF